MNIRSHLLLPAFWLVVSSLSPSRPPAVGLRDAASSGSLLLLVMDARELNCPPCLESILSLCRALPEPIRRERIRGIFVPATEPDFRDDSVPILLKKVRGLWRGGDLDFPVLLDDEFKLKGLIEEGSALLLLSGNTVKFFRLPLQTDQLREIQERLLDTDR